jgi:hypothetical protein
MVYSASCDEAILMCFCVADAVSVSFILDETFAGAPITGAKAIGFVCGWAGCCCGAVRELTAGSVLLLELVSQAAKDKAIRPATRGNAARFTVRRAS